MDFKHKRFFSLFSILFLTFALCSFNLEPDVSRIFENSNQCIRHFDGERVYLNADQLKVTNEGIFLALDGEELIPLEKVESNEYGVFVSVETLMGGRPGIPRRPDIKIHWTCQCGREYLWNQNCSTPGCPRNPLTQRRK